MVTEIFKIVILSIVQGITEFLPISSSGHLVISQHVLGFKEDNLYYAIVLHAGTLCSILVYYAKDLLEIVKRRQLNIILFVAIGTLPLIAVGLVIKPILENYFSSLLLVSFCLAITAVMLLVVHNPINQKKSLDEMTWSHALIIGVLQCVAILPGVSRSGTTISIGTRLGFTNEAAARFSFYLAIPAIFGAVLLETLDLIKEYSRAAESVSISIPLTFIGLTVSFIVGFVALKLLLHLLKAKKFSYFGYYCLALSLCTLILVFI